MNGFRYLHEAYTATDPHYTGKVTVPTLWDRKTRRIVNNEFPDIIRMLNSEFAGIAGDDTDFYPEPLRAEIDRLNEIVYANVNNGVYRCGFARSQAAYEAAYDALFATLDELEARLAASGTCSAAGSPRRTGGCFPRWCASTSPISRCFAATGSASPTIPICATTCASSYQLPGIAETVKARYYVINYWSIARLNPAGIIPKGTPVDFTPPHDRARLAN